MNNQYVENPEHKDFPEFDRVYKRYKDLGFIKPQVQIRTYEAIANHWCVGKSVLDAGCGIGIGTNIMGREAIGAYGIDQCEDSIKVAKQLYEGPRIKFDQFDLIAPPTRPVATFDIVVCLEVIEHIADYQKALDTLKKFGEFKRRTVFFISSPNRNNEELGKESPHNPLHVREWSASEFYEIMTKNFQSVVLYDCNVLDTFGIQETVDGNTIKTPLLAKCEFPL